MKFVKLQAQGGVKCVSLQVLPGLEVVALSAFPDYSMCCPGSLVLRGSKGFFHSLMDYLQLTAGAWILAKLQHSVQMGKKDIFVPEPPVQSDLCAAASGRQPHGLEQQN